MPQYLLEGADTSECIPAIAYYDFYFGIKGNPFIVAT